VKADSNSQITQRLVKMLGWDILMFKEEGLSYKGSQETLVTTG
jgi:hypothetical protein